MATTIVRPTIVDDDGSGTSGTILDSAWLTDFMNKIDALFTGAFSVVGPLTLTSNPATYGVIFDGSNGGGIAATHASGALRFYSGGTTLRGQFLTTGEFSAVLGMKANTSGAITSSFANGLNVGGYDVVGYTAFKAVLGGYRGSEWTSLGLYTSGTERLLISSAGVVTLGAYTAATFAAGDKYLVVDANGVIHRSALGPAS